MSTITIPYCEECGAPLVKSPGGYATCPNLHGRLKQIDVFHSVWVPRLIEASIDVRKIPDAEYVELVGPRGGKKRVIKIGERAFRRDTFGVPLNNRVVASLDGKLVCLSERERESKWSLAA